VNYYRIPESTGGLFGYAQGSDNMRHAHHHRYRVRDLCESWENQGPLCKWFWVNSLISGVLAAVWLVLRSAAKPSRLTYPCQQAAMGTMLAAFGAPLAGSVLVLRNALIASRGRPVTRAVVMAGLAVVVSTGAWGLFSSSAPAVNVLTGLEPRADYRADLFVIDDAAGPDGQHYGGLDDLIAWMGVNGLKFYQSSNSAGFESGPSGIIAAADVVVIKINYQWDQRGGTNVDLLRGLIRRILDHPDGFEGEIVVCENAQFVSVDGFDRLNNNAEDYQRSPHDVVIEFQNEGSVVSHYDWTAVRIRAVAEYSAGDMNDGYVVYPFNSAIQGCVSYPKFRTVYGTQISLKYGIWDPAGAAYDRNSLKFINVPVLKSHHSTYGVTACVKDYMGVVTGTLSTNSHGAIRYGLLGALLGEIRLADLNILDCIWINANPLTGPSTPYSGATRVDKLVAATDPVAADIWAAKNILIPAFVANGYSPPWPSPSADPDNPASAFRVYLDNSMNQLLAAGSNVTNDLARVSAHRWNGDLGVTGDINGDGFVDGLDIQPFLNALLGTSSKPLSILRSDMDFDRDVDGEDLFALIESLLSS
jgi:hypothetical protein